MDIQSSNMSGGSGAEIIHIEDRVHKSVPISDINSFIHLNNQYLWMKAHNEMIDNLFPNVYNCIFEKDKFGYMMQYIEPCNFKPSITNIVAWMRAIDDCPFPVKKVDFKIYIDRLYSHLVLLKDSTLGRSLLKYKKINVNINGIKREVNNVSLFQYFEILEHNRIKYNNIISNCHGDFTLGNIVGNKLIDSNHLIGEWNSWILDTSKLMQSLHYNYEDIFSKKCKSSCIYTTNEFSLDIKYPKDNRPFTIEDMSKDMALSKDTLLFELSHYLRMLKYKNRIDYIKAYCIMCLIWDDIKRGYLE